MWGLKLLHFFSSFFQSYLLASPDVPMAAKFTLSSDSDSDPSEEVEEGENSQSSTEQEQQVLPPHALTLPELRMAGKKTDEILWQ